jgi:hypothetical protein
MAKAGWLPGFVPIPLWCRSRAGQR